MSTHLNRVMSLFLGETQESLSMSFSPFSFLGQNIMSKIEKCQTLVIVFKNEFLRFLSNELEWKMIVRFRK